MSLSKKTIFIIVVILIVVLIIGYFYFSNGKKTSPEFVVANKGSIVQEVSVTGNVKPVTGVDLAFEKTGKISSVSTWYWQLCL